MRALVLAGKEQFDLVDLQHTSPAENEVALRVAATAICRTDAKMWKSGHRDLVLPRIPGHEICGYIEEDPEKLYTIWPGSACGSCSACRNGRENLCPEMQIIGFHRDGGFAEILNVPESSLLKVPKGLKPSVATLAEPLACAIHGIKQSRTTGNDRVLVYGAGTLGILISLAAIDRGASVSLTDPNTAKLAQSAVFRARYGIKAEARITSGSFDVVFNAASPADTLACGIHRLAPGGRFCLFSGLGGTTEHPELIFHELHYRELELIGSYGCTMQDMRDALVLLNRYRNDIGFLVERELQIEEVPTMIGSILEGKRFRHVIVMHDSKTLTSSPFQRTRTQQK
ncbi:MAG: alcohol dehydrogenase catalytic domain-containing protein [Chlorobiaceae bacterium]|nr:alcohol dehydrogenase catalytic domain-containing protein [Chlorobiaceae bacterium]